MSSSPSARRNLKPSPVAAPPLSPKSHHLTTTEPPSLQPAVSTTSATAAPESQASAQPPLSPNSNRKRKSVTLTHLPETMSSSTGVVDAKASSATPQVAADVDSPVQEPKLKKSRTNTPWTPAEELRLKQMRDAGNSWSEIAKTFPQRTEGSVKKHWYKDMHYAEFAEDESAALLAAIKEYDANKWKAIGLKVGKPAKACEQYAKEHFGGKY
ncbi:hypothetical protein DE146DRAFT_392119 [Phaeosphaeria sp. MPI-PUGE-AT-0046c]|nr:hypothetical protein DE146DRAFT_392119 [Phaeosphaeria sp. MPI-PUGE-AT-0046c]